MQSRVSIVGLSIHKNKNAYFHYQQLPAKEQVDYLVDKIKHICQQLQLIAPRTKWVLAWAEHGVSGTQGEPLTPQEKHYFKTQFQELTKHYSQLAIIAGSVKTCRVYSKEHERDKLDHKVAKVSKAYDDSIWVADVESTDDQFEYHRRQLESYKASGSSPITTIVRNTAYVFANGRCVARHDKLAPYNEVDTVGAFFRVGGGRSKSTLIDVVFTDGEVIPVGVEICREHSLGVLAHHCAVEHRHRPLIHFVVSDTVGHNENRMHGDYFVQVDMHKQVRYKAIDDSSKRVTVYSFDVFTPEAMLVLKDPMDSANAVRGINRFKTVC